MVISSHIGTQFMHERGREFRAQRERFRLQRLVVQSRRSAVQWPRVPRRAGRNGRRSTPATQSPHGV
jgi:hypothetical protein